MGRNAISKQFKDDYATMGSYRGVARSWDISKGLAWRIINEDYWPKDADIKRKLYAKARERGMLIRRRGRKRDLLSMSPGELVWRLENREPMGEPSGEMREYLDEITGS